MHFRRQDMDSTTAHPMTLLAARVVTAALLTIGALTISSGDARAIPLEGDNDRGVTAVTSSGTLYMTAARAATPPDSHTAMGGPQEY